MSGHKSFCLQTNVKSMRTASQSGGGLAWQFYAGINLTGYHPPGAFALKCVPSPRAFAQQKMPGGRANKFKMSLGPGICINMKIVNIVIWA